MCEVSCDDSWSTRCFGKMLCNCWQAQMLFARMLADPAHVPRLVGQARRLPAKMAMRLQRPENPRIAGNITQDGCRRKLDEVLASLSITGGLNFLDGHAIAVLRLFGKAPSCKICLLNTKELLLAEEERQPLSCSDWSSYIHSA